MVEFLLDTYTLGPDSELCPYLANIAILIEC